MSFHLIEGLGVLGLIGLWGVNGKTGASTGILA